MPLTVRRSARLSTYTPEPIRARARRWILSSWDRWWGAAPPHARGLYSMRGLTNPLYAVSWPEMSRTRHALRRKPRRCAARIATERRWFLKLMDLSNTTPRSLMVAVSSTFSPPNDAAGMGHWWRWRVIVMACDFDGSNWMRQVVLHSASASIPVWSVLQLVGVWLAEGMRTYSVVSSA